MSETTETTETTIIDEKGAFSDPTPDEGRVSNATPDDGLDTTEGTEDEQDTFPRDYVEKLRDENAKYRQRAQRADDLARRLHTALVAATGRLHDPSDLEFNEDHLEDAEALQNAVEALLGQKPHLASRKPSGSIGQGATGSASGVDLAGMLRARA